MKISYVSSLLVLFLLSLSGTAMAQTAADGVAIADAYVRAVPPGQPNSASFMSVKNNSGTHHALVSGSSPAAEAVELHTHTMEGGMMRMRQVEKIDLPAGESVDLKPGGLHVMMIGLKQKLIPGESVPLTLKFEDGSEVMIDAPVRKLQMKMKKMDHKHMH
ncbi:MAG: copper chaperone PCu(A)C [Candidatus Thiodiazotropha sp. (ex Monitilora ramsayi)]|nr:copper chaperone PCu(A)C [Candidatus Thiodiazotropha sp. (ex Monitilora ramsayi)]